MNAVTITRERPILFSGPMVRAILDGRKTQTRRIVKPQPEVQPNGVWRWDTGRKSGLMGLAGNHWRPEAMALGSPHGHAGDRLWVREAFSGPWELRSMPPALWLGHMPPIWFWADGDPTWGDWTRPKPSIHMPRWASRITLEITGVRVERLQDISEEDALSEGVAEYPDGFHWEPNPEPAVCRLIGRTAQKAFFGLWEEINGRDSFDANPFVWVIEFKQVHA